jgi:class 3 adenylate cyclase
VLFADIKGSMDLMEDLDPEEARSIVDPAMKLMIDAVRRNDGSVVPQANHVMASVELVADEAASDSDRIQQEVGDQAEQVQSSREFNLEAKKFLADLRLTGAVIATQPLRGYRT